MDEVKVSAKQVAVCADLSHPNVWSLEIMCAGYYKLLITSIMPIQKSAGDAQIAATIYVPRRNTLEKHSQLRD